MIDPLPYQDFVPPTMVQFLVIVAVSFTPSLAWLGYHKLRENCSTPEDDEMPQSIELCDRETGLACGSRSGAGPCRPKRKTC